MTPNRIKEIQMETAYPQSQSVYLALNKVWNECVQTNSIESLIDRNYNAQIRRGQITPDSTFFKFVIKIEDELMELNESYIETNKDFDPKELIDIMLVCFSMAKHFKIDWQQVMTEKVKYNETRED